MEIYITAYRRYNLLIKSNIIILITLLYSDFNSEIYGQCQISKPDNIGIYFKVYDFRYIFSFILESTNYFSKY